MDLDQTRSLEPHNSVLYHCACGTKVVLAPNVGGVCENCSKKISPELLPKLIEHDLGVTVELGDENFQVEQGFPLREVPESTGAAASIDTETQAQPESDKLVGQMFGHFRLVSPLGKGGMGQVYRALDTSLQRFVAVKLLRSGIETSPEQETAELTSPPGGSAPTAPGDVKSSDDGTTSRSSDKEIEKLLQEAVSQARVTHPNIVTIFYVGKQNGDPFLAMELVNGRPLSQRIATQKHGFDEIVSVALDISQALAFSYQLDIIHGDIKPSNVLITKNGTAKLSDFGMARSASNNEDKTIGGTPNYIAPEILHRAKPSLQSDIYALGVTLFEMTFGKLPRTLTGRSIQRWIKIHDSAEIDYPSTWPARFPEQWKSILSKMLAKDPTRRFQSYESLLTELRRIEPGSKVPARLLPRIFAAAIDWATVLSLAVVVQVALASPNWGAVGASHPAIVTLLKIADFLPIIAYTVLIYVWRQSIGRNLMHLRVVNQHGMRPSGKLMAIRSAIRMQFPLFLICRILFANTLSGWAEVAMAALVVVSMVLLLLDIAFMLMYSQSRSLHDLAVNTRVVLDTEQ